MGDDYPFGREEREGESGKDAGREPGMREGMVIVSGKVVMERILRYCPYV